MPEIKKNLCIGIIGSPKTYGKERFVKDLIFKIKNELTGFEIVSGGNLEGIEVVVKNICLSFKLKYGEFNPAFTLRNEYSRLKPEYYDKEHNYSQYFGRYYQMCRFINKLIIVSDENNQLDTIYTAVKKHAEKWKIKTTVV